MSFIKHVGKHQDRKVAILWREVPSEEHMCLVIYPEVLPAPWHDTIMRVLESPEGQATENFADMLHRSLLPDGRKILETLHIEKMIKKIRASDVQVTPRPGSSIRLDELNKMINEMKQGEEAIRKMSENDAARGLVAPDVKRGAEADYKSSQQNPIQPVQAGPDGALDDRSLAANMLAQAQRMEQDARGLIAEAARMKKEAETLFPNVTPAILPPPPEPPRRGRPPKTTKVADAAE